VRFSPLMPQGEEHGFVNTWGVCARSQVVTSRLFISHLCAGPKFGKADQTPKLERIGQFMAVMSNLLR
jgi:hypothetical protein